MYFRLDMRRNVFTEGMLGHWNRLPSTVMESLSLAGTSQCVIHEPGSQPLAQSFPKLMLPISILIPGPLLESPKAPPWLISSHPFNTGHFISFNHIFGSYVS